MYKLLIIIFFFVNCLKNKRLLRFLLNYTIFMTTMFLERRFEELINTFLVFLGVNIA